eukprot:8480146-Lingulodinium_polyedra.AAC.1
MPYAIGKSCSKLPVNITVHGQRNELAMSASRCKLPAGNPQLALFNTSLDKNLNGEPAGSLASA